MQIREVKERNPLLLEQLVAVWESSVQATHLFLTAGEIAAIKQYVPAALKDVDHLLVAEDEGKKPVAFMGLSEPKLEMLFIAPAARGRGLGKRLVSLAIDNYAINQLTVNEQNPQAQGFYEHLGFQVYKRTERDEQGNPYPLLYLKLEN